MNPRFRVPSLLVWLTGLWVMLWGDLTVGNLVGGFLVAVGVLTVARPVGVHGLDDTYFRPIAALRYSLYFLVQLVKSNLVIAWEIVTPRVAAKRTIIAVPMHTTSAGVVNVVANSLTLTPGTVTIDVLETPRADDPDMVDRTLLIHVLYFGDLTGVRRDVLRLERLAIRAFGPADDLARLESRLESSELR